MKKDDRKTLLCGGIVLARKGLLYDPRADNKAAVWRKISEKIEVGGLVLP